jgi:hypothetical protein
MVEDAELVFPEFCCSIRNFIKQAVLVVSGSKFLFGAMIIGAIVQALGDI